MCHVDLIGCRWRASTAWGTARYLLHLPLLQELCLLGIRLLLSAKKSAPVVATRVLVVLLLLSVLSRSAP